MRANPLLIIPCAIAVYLVAISGAWFFCTQQAEGNARALLERSETDFAETIEDTVDSVLLHCGGTLVREFGTVSPRSVDEMKRRIACLEIDEANVVDSTYSR